MANDYKPLATYSMGSDVSFFHPVQPLPQRVHADDPAVLVMTDLRQVRAMTIGPNATIDLALDKMIRDGVRMLLVISPRGILEGIVTARDIQGEKPVKFVQEQGGRNPSPARQGAG
jgi:signal-transduction protein with cAMP-binding, CBS, and nucleotidyltransferase domain